MRIILLTLSVLVIIGCEKDPSLSDFKSDGCSLFPDSSLITNQDWCECCYKHDLAYWKGGTEAERLDADKELKRCILQKTESKELAELMFQGVRLGGSPYFYNWYRWGYGWSYDRKYGRLTEKELSQVTDKLSLLESEGGNSPCQ